jgi:Na+-transporting NADH:ubiquinone oxidoreductase subunit C
MFKNMIEKITGSSFYKKNKPVLKVVYFAFYLSVLGMLVTSVAALGYNATADRIEQNKIDTINSNIALLYSAEDGYTRNENQIDNKYLQSQYDLINDIYEVLDSNGDLYVIIYNVSAQGRNGLVSALVAIDPYTDTVQAVTYYDHSETPNIGEKYTREDEISKLIGQSVATNVEVDVIANASTTWLAIEAMFNEIETHYNEQGVHIDG